MRLLRILAWGTGLAAGVYGSYAAWTWARYGRVKDATLNRFLPRPEVIERNVIEVKAPADITYDRCRNFDLMQSTVPRLLFDTRSIVMSGKAVHTKSPEGFVNQMTAMGWTLLEERPGREIILGVAAQPWRSDAGFRAIPKEEFAAFNEKGWVKIVVNMSVTPLGEDSLVRTETRAMTTDAEARKRFRKYWAFVSPGVKLIRFAALRTIKVNAEAVCEKKSLPLRSHLQLPARPR